MKKYSVKKKELFNGYGYDYSRKDLVVTGIMVLLAVAFVCYIHKLQSTYFLLVMATVGIMFPVMVSAYFKYKSEKTKFDEYCIYFENMKLYFKTYKKLIIALEETQKLFSEKSAMKECIGKAIEEVKATGDYQKALGYIDERYHNSYLMRLHNLLITGEKQGSDAVYYNLDLINYEEWKEDIKQFQSRKKSSKYMFYFLSLLSLGISIYTAYVFTMDDTMAQIVSSLEYQLYTFFELEVLLMMFIYVYIELVNKKWIRSDE